MVVQKEELWKYTLSHLMFVSSALPEEARAFLDVVRSQCESTIEERSSPRYHFSYRFVTIKNNKDEPLTLHISWLLPLWATRDDAPPFTYSGGMPAPYRHHDWDLRWRCGACATRR